MTTPVEPIEALAARAAITDVLYRYALGIDTGDRAAVVACFAPDARLDFLGLEVLEGDEVRAMFEGRRQGVRAIDLDALHTSTHLMGNVLVDLIDRDTAHAETSAVAYLVGERSGEPAALVRGLRYSDDLIRVNDQWLIRNRVQRLQWMLEGTGATLP